jgi:hypothetical protein
MRMACPVMNRQSARNPRHWLAPVAVLTFAVLLTAGRAESKSRPATEDDDLAVVLVLGEQPGPGLWKVSSGEHVLWVLGEVSPIPRKVKWRSRKFEILLGDSRELLLDLSGYWRADFDDMAAYRRAERLPKGVTLKDVIPPGLHERVVQTAQLFGAPELEELHPFAATNRLVTSAMKSLGLDGFSARFAAEDYAKRHRIKITSFAAPEPSFEERLRIWQEPANAVCLERAVDVLEDGGTGVKRLANAWSIGDIAALRELVTPYSFSRDGFRADECAAAMRGGEREALEYKAVRTKAWLAEAERVLRDNDSTVAVVLMSELFATDGYLAALRERGYEVVEPE